MWIECTIDRFSGALLAREFLVEFLPDLALGDGAARPATPTVWPVMGFHHAEARGFTVRAIPSDDAH